MDMKKCCEKMMGGGATDGYEVARIAKAPGGCSLCEDFAKKNEAKPVAVMCCEGACLRGEVARRAANIICHELAKDKTVRICLGGAFLKDTGQRGLVRNSGRLIALEGCGVNCSSRMMQGVIEGLTPELIIADRLYEFDRQMFGVDEATPQEIDAWARTVAEKIAATL